VLAQRAGRRALIVLEAHPDPRLTGSYVRALCLLSGVYEDVADHVAAQLLLQRVLILLPEVPKDPHDAAIVVETLTRLGNLARLQGQYELAGQHLLRALRVAESGLGGAQAVTGARNVLAITYKDSGRYAEAAALYADVLSDVLTRLGPKSSAAATCYHNLAGLAYAKGDYAGAEPLARRAVRLRTRLVGARHQTVAADLAVLAAVLLGEHELDQAEQAYRQALTIYSRVFGAGHYEVAVILNGLATIESERGRWDRAEPLYRRALAIKEQVLGPEHPEIGVLLNNLAVVHRKAGRFDAASGCYRRALPLLSRSLGDDHPTVVACSENLVAALMEQERNQQGRSPKESPGDNWVPQTRR